MSDWHLRDASAMAAALAGGEVTSVQLVSAQLERIDSANDALGAFITLTHERALQQAEQADTLRRAGDRRTFLGVPTAFKDLSPTAGVRTTMGSVLLRDQVPEHSSHVVNLVEAAGFISVGKTNTPEFGLSSYTDNDLIGPARTPWDRRRVAGGSSGGAAAAVAAGLLPLALGSDGGGSIRIPASCCGVFGFKPSRGTISAGPFGSEWSGLTTDGAITRSARDMAAMLDILMRRQPGDSRIGAGPIVPFRDQLDRSPRRLRIAAWTRPWPDFAQASPESVRAWHRAIEVLTELGHDIVEVDNPFPAELDPQFNAIWSSAVAAAPVPPELEETLRPNTQYWRQRGRELSAIELVEAMNFVESTTRSRLSELRSFDAMLTPTLAMPPPLTQWFNESGNPAEDHRRELQFTPYTAAYNMSGQPAASLPLYMTTETEDRPALPIGIMLAAHPGEDALLLRLCAQLERAGSWTTRAPS